jgi:putative Mg2+ transporter-C (MgtC) family protein
MNENHAEPDPARIAAQVASGIGFLGAGSIILRNQIVRGLTTAASISSLAAIGVAAGGGLYWAAGVSTAIIFIILAGLKPSENAYRARVQSGMLRIDAPDGFLDEDDLMKALGVRGRQIRTATIDHPPDEKNNLASIHFIRVSTSDIDALNRLVQREPGIKNVEVVSQPTRAR